MATVYSVQDEKKNGGGGVETSMTMSAKKAQRVL
jgi:hypothetical protein